MLVKRNFDIINMHGTTIKIKKTIMYIVLYGCEIWPVLLKEEHRLRVFESRVLRRIFGQRTVAQYQDLILHGTQNCQIRDNSVCVVTGLRAPSLKNRGLTHRASGDLTLLHIVQAVCVTHSRQFQATHNYHPQYLFPLVSFYGRRGSRLHDEELFVLHPSPIIIQVIK